MPDAPTVSPARRLSLAYLAVFGSPDKRTSDQHLVWQDIESFCYAYRLCREGKPDGDLSNNFDLNEGRRSFFLRARGMMIKALSEPKPQTISRKKSNP